MSYTNEGENYRKYGIVIIESYDNTLGYTVYEYRKPTIKERQEIILNYIIQNNNEPIDLIYLSNKLCVSKRTIQKDVKELTLELLYIKIVKLLKIALTKMFAHNKKILNVLLAHNQKL